MASSIVVVGSINMDLVVRAQHAPGPGETVQGRSLAYMPGGKGANQAVAAARLGAHTRMVARIGDDSLGDTVRRNLQDNDVDLSHVTVAPGTSQGLAIIIVEDSGQNRIVLSAGSNACLSPEDVDAARSAFTPEKVVLLQNEVHLQTTVQAARLAKASGALVMWNPAPAPDSLPMELAGCVDVILPNESETQRLTGIGVQDEAGVEQAATALLEKGFPNVVMTRGESGAQWFSREGTIQAPAFKVEVVDTTAAGDTFCGALAVALAEGMAPQAAMRLACGAAALAVTKLGAQSGIPTRAQLEAFLAER